MSAIAKATTDGWLNAGSGKSGIVFQYRIRKDDAQVSLRIRKHDAASSKVIFDALYARKEKVEEVFGAPLEWQRLDNQKTSHIAHIIPSGGLGNQDRWQEIQDWMIDAMVRLEQALKPEIRRLE